MTIEAEIFTVTVTALNRVGTRIDGVRREIVAVVHDGEDRVAVLMAVDAERIAVTVLARHRIGAGHGAVRAQPADLVILRQQGREVRVAGRTRRRRGSDARRTGAVAVVTSGAAGE